MGCSSSSNNTKNTTVSGNPHASGKPVLTLHYGNIPVWRAEIIRLPLWLAKVNYEDKRYEPYYGPEMLAAVTKDNVGHAPFITLPDGRTLGQTAGIARYVTDLCDFTPKDPWLAMKVDEIIHCTTDFSGAYKDGAMSVVAKGVPADTAAATYAQ